MIEYIPCFDSTADHGLRIMRRSNTCGVCGVSMRTFARMDVRYGDAVRRFRVRYGIIAVALNLENKIVPK